MIGSQLILSMIERFPIIVWAGAALLGWIAGEMIIGDPIVERAFGLVHHGPSMYVAAAIGAIIVVLIGLWLKSRAPKGKPETVQNE
jgi:predicted tellurium resistance membrane protein TerC